MNDRPQNNEAGASQDNAGLPALRALAVPAPANVFTRFRRRATLMQGTRMLFESQVTGFWVVLDAFLRMFLGAGGRTTKTASIQRSAQGDRA